MAQYLIFAKLATKALSTNHRPRANLVGRSENCTEEDYFFFVSAKISGGEKNELCSEKYCTSKA
jgi:hypothetical protein